jgi:hypothetical protein
MGSGKTTEDKGVTGAAAALGIKHTEELVKLDREALARFTQKQLFECAKRLQVKGVSKLSKDDLAGVVAAQLSVLLEPASDAKAGGEPAPVAPQPSPTAVVSVDTAWSHKFEVPDHGKEEAPSTIPWSYGYDRVTGMAVDPERLFVYWEVTDDAIERARTGLGAAGKGAWLTLRVYDTTDRIFDGTNAHSYFDHKVERSDRHWFFNVSKPSSSAFVDIGLKSGEGYFVKIVRSGRVEFPRREPTTWGEPEWLSVRSLMGPIEHAGRGPHVRRQAPGIAPPPPAAMPGQGQRRHVALLPWEETIATHEGEQKEIIEWEEHFSDGTTEYHRETTWESPVMVSAWEAGPFSFPVSAPEPVREDFVGPARVYRVGGRTHVVHGPWQVVIKGIGAHQGRSVVARWEIYRSWIGEEKADVVGGRMEEVAIPGSSEKLLMGASEKRLRYASEMRLGGASEVFFLGASEYRAKGASERFFMGASQYKMRGASERQYLGGSEVRMRGASERMLGGASELRLGGASERHIGGASERLGGASEQRLGGASEELGGGSEDRLHPQDNGASAPMDNGGYPSTESISNEPEHKE